MKHTQGEWMIDDANPEMVAILKDGIYQYICDCATELHDGCITQDQEKANAKLIAAAPDLLEACKFALNSIQKSQPMKGSRLDMASIKLMNVIKKAESL